jgi:hypothetical protein
MLFEEALAMLKEGKSMCRESWSLEDGYLQIMTGMDYVWKIVLKPSPNAGNFIFCIADFTATDWKEFEMPKECVEQEIALDKEAA